MNLDQLKTALGETDVLALTAWAEARGDFNQGNSSVEERIAVMSVIRNRMLSPSWWGDSYRAVCMRRWQFSCWNQGSDPNHLALVALATKVVENKAHGDATFEETRFLAEGIRRGFILDRVGGADHYYAPKAMRPAGTVPDWARLPDGGTKRPDAIVGDQHFYKLGPTA